MLLRTTTLLKYRATTPGGDHLPIAEALFDPRTGAVRFLVLDVGHWFTETDVLISVREMGEIDTDAHEWRTGLDRETIEAAPRWSDRAQEMTALALENWPPLIVGPFGSTYAPIALEAQLFAHSEPHGTRISKLQGLDTLSEWMGLPAFGDEGELGHVSDFTMDTETHILRHVVLESGGMTSRTRHAVPFSDLRYRAEGGGHAVFHVDASALKDAPDPDRLEGMAG